MTLIFVFGSNEAGRHGRGAAFHAFKAHGALYGHGNGLQGQSYAIPTKSKNLRPLTIPEIEAYVERFWEFAMDNPEMTFFVTRVGCGLAGYKDEDIGPLFLDMPDNVFLPSQWKKWGKNFWSKSCCEMSEEMK